MKKTTLLISLSFAIGCSADKPAKVGKVPTYTGSTSNSNPAPAKTESEKAPVSSDVFKDLPLAIEGVPSGQSDLNTFKVSVKAHESITFFSYKVGQALDCKNGEDFKVTPITTTPTIDITSIANGLMTLCVLAYHSPSKTWQTVASAKVMTWEKIPFTRVIQSEYSEYNVDCRKEIKTQATLDIIGNIASYAWKTDFLAQGCAIDTASGKDIITIVANNDESLRGHWTFQGGSASGWLDFKWSNNERTAFKGTFGYGDPSLEAAGPWNSVP